MTPTNSSVGSSATTWDCLKKPPRAWLQLQVLSSPSVPEFCGYPGRKTHLCAVIGVLITQANAGSSSFAPLLPRGESSPQTSCIESALLLDVVTVMELRGLPFGDVPGSALESGSRSGVVSLMGQNSALQVVFCSAGVYSALCPSRRFLPPFLPIAPGLRRRPCRAEQGRARPHCSFGPAAELFRASGCCPAPWSRCPACLTGHELQRRIFGASPCNLRS